MSDGIVFCPGSDDPRCRGICTLNQTTGEILDPDCFRSAVPEEDWWHVLRNTYTGIMEKGSALDFPSDRQVRDALRQAVEALTALSTELVVAEAKSNITAHQQEIDAQINLLKSLGRSQK